MRSALMRLRQQLVALVVDPPRNGAANLVQAEAAGLLILGVELFFPTQHDQAELLHELLTKPSAHVPPAGNETKQHSKGVFEGSGDRDKGSAEGATSSGGGHLGHRLGWYAARHFLLRPLLRRLADDRIAAKLVPSEKAKDHSAAAPPGASPAVLSRLLSLLATQAATKLEARGSDGGGHGDEEEETAALVTELLLTVQKHLLS